LKLQIKSRVAIDSGSFRIRSFDFNFVVFVRLNRGTKASRKLGQREGELSPAFYVVPKAALLSRERDGTVRIPKGWLAEHEQFREDWASFRKALTDDAPSPRA
jgi:hypothetical protein